jgi:hypothetical protein
MTRVILLNYWEKCKKKNDVGIVKSNTVNRIRKRLKKIKISILH